MSKRSLKSKRRSKALPALSFAGASLSMASGACASTSEASANTPPTSQSQNQEIFLGEEEIFDVSLSTFYVFDKENGGASPLAQHLKLARGGCGGCGHGGGGCGGHGGGLRMRPWLRLWPWRFGWLRSWWLCIPWRLPMRRLPRRLPMRRLPRRLPMRRLPRRLPMRRPFL